jgi:hypothetical protein
VEVGGSGAGALDDGGEKRVGHAPETVGFECAVEARVQRGRKLGDYMCEDVRLGYAYLVELGGTGMRIPLNLEVKVFVYQRAFLCRALISGRGVQDPNP